MISDTQNRFCRQCGKAFHGTMSCVAHPQEICFSRPECLTPIGEVFLVGEWSKWQKLELMRELSSAPNEFIARVSLPIGRHRFKFIVDGEWTVNPAYPVTQNDFNVDENILEVYPATIEQLFHHYKDIHVPDHHDFSHDHPHWCTLRISTGLPVAHKIFLRGSWDNWSSELALEEVVNLAIGGQQTHQVFIRVPAGRYNYKFIIDGIWQHDEYKLGEPDGQGGQNNIVVGRGQTKLNSSFQYDRLSWSQIDLGDLNFAAIQGHSMDLIGDTIYIFGGFYHNNFLETVYGINIDTLEVVSLETRGKCSPDRRAYHSSTVIGAALFIYGGLNERNIFNDLFILDTVLLKWTKVNINSGEQPPALERCSFTNINHELLLVFGGYKCTADLEIEENFNSLYSCNLDNFVWKKVHTENTPEERYSHSANSLNSSLYIFGGIKRMGNTTQIYNDLYALDLTQKESLVWRQITDYKGQSPSPRYAHSSIIINDFLVVFGGRRDKNLFLNDVHLYLTKDNTWVCCQVQNVAPQGRCFHGCVAINHNEVLVFGGQKANSFLNVGRMNAIYSLRSNQWSNLRYVCSDDKYRSKGKAEKNIRFV